MTTYRLLNNILGWLAFAIAAVVYTMTIEPTASFWDCGEYIACSYKLEVGHPPGAPLFVLLGRFFTLFAGGDVTQAAMWVNLMSGVCSAFTILFLFWTITAFGKRMVAGRGYSGIMSSGNMIAVLGSGLVGALAFTFSDSFWFSAVEGEVYAMSSFFTAIVFWAILKWEDDEDEEHSNRWIILIAYLVGLSIGVHLLNLLAIPAIVFVYYFKNYEPNLKGLIVTGIVSILILGGIQAGIIPGLVSLAASFELTFVNTFNLPFHSGTIFYFLLLASIIVTVLVYTHSQSQKVFNLLLVLAGVFVLLSLVGAPSLGSGIIRLIVEGVIFGLLVLLRQRPALFNTIFLSLTVMIIGYSSFAILVIRSNANTPMDENNPENAINLLSYLNREQYGDWPILYGQYYNTPLDNNNPYKDGTPVYTKDEKSGKYIITDDRKSSIPNYAKEFSTIFPRMWSQQGNHEAAYKNWGEIVGERKTYNSRGELQTIVKPTMGENLRYFRRYQLGWMYFRYFAWNFIGRQNDIQGHGNITDGNYYWGIKGLDEGRLGPQDNLPTAYQDNKATNKLYGLPLLMGLLGMIYHFMRRRSDAFVVFLLFFFTGLAIVVYLNQYPYQPRERDYAYAGSFYAFAIWIGLGVFGLYGLITDKIKSTANGTNSNALSKNGDIVVSSPGNPVAGLGITLLCLCVPVLMAFEEWDDHDRSKRYTATQFAKNYLQSCAPNAILFTNGDNDTFPLWYVQEVEGFRTDVRVVNLSLLQTDWYIDQMKRKAYDSNPVPLSLTNEKYRQGTRDVVYFIDREIKGHITVRELIDFVADDRNKYDAGGGRQLEYFPTNKMRVPVDTLKVVKNGTVPAKLASRVVPSIDWTLEKSYVMKNDLMVLDLLATNNWERPIYFAVTTGPDSYLGLEDYFQLEGLAYRLVPVKASPQERSRVATDIMYDNIMNKFEWGSMDVDGVYLDENILRMATNMRIQMGTLATSLMAEGKKDSAQKVLDKCIEKMPHKNVPYDATIFSVAYAYYQAGATDKANKLAQQLFDIFEHDLKYYAKLDREQRVSYNRDIRQGLEVLRNLVAITEQYKQTELSKKYEDRYIELVKNHPALQEQQQPGR